MHRCGTSGTGEEREVQARYGRQGRGRQVRGGRGWAEGCKARHREAATTPGGGWGRLGAAAAAAGGAGGATHRHTRCACHTHTHNPTWNCASSASSRSALLAATGTAVFSSCSASLRGGRKARPRGGGQGRRQAGVWAGPRRRVGGWAGAASHSAARCTHRCMHRALTCRPQHGYAPRRPGSGRTGLPGRGGTPAGTHRGRGRGQGQGLKSERLGG